jgi:quercetin dioxygenase-like cupin family protein
VSAQYLLLRPRIHGKEEVMRYLGATIASVALSALAVPSGIAQQAGGHGHVVVAPSDMKWMAAPSLPPGAQIAVIEGPLNQSGPFTFRAKFPANYQIPPHSHPNVEHVTVIAGTFNVGLGDKADKSQAKSLMPGAFAIVQPDMPHYAWTGDETTIQVHGVGPWDIKYVNPEDDPRATTGSAR